ncbi:transketolase [Candidatus Dependentiae bacterium]|nr:transketolase [Candidatus Dependentiae bacterium]
MAFLPNEIRQFLAHVALQLRIDSLRATTQAKSGHPTSCLSAADMIAAIFFHILRYDLKNPKNRNNDRFILSKGHAIPIVYAAYKQLGVVSDQELLELRTFDAHLEGHPTPRFAYNEAATGSLGQGLSVGVGMALNAKMEKLNYRTIVMMGDAEIAEGSVWEAAELAAHYHLNNLIALVDCNRLGQSGQTMHDHEVKRHADKFAAFGWHTLIIDGHNLDQIVDAFTQAQAVSEKPTMIIAKTYKGYGLEGIENLNGFHGKPLNMSELEDAIRSLVARFHEASQFAPKKPFIMAQPHESHELEHHRMSGGPLSIIKDTNGALFAQGKSISTRKAFGYALAALGRANSAVVALDGDVKNSTYTDIFEAEFPDRFIQCFVAEQNMVGAAVGLQARGKVPFAATFGAFFTRAHDQIRMAGIGRNAVRLCGSHCGVSIGQDGPSQMALEDIALMRAIPGSIVLYPSDGVSTYKLVEQMGHYHDGISYIRTTRADVPILYGKHENFLLGECKVIRRTGNDQVCIVGAGITLFEALKAHETLWARDISVSVVDLYSIKPLPVEQLVDLARDANNKIITVEDHYVQGGFGEAIASALVNTGITVQTMGVTGLSRSGTPEELLNFAGIDAQAIVKAVELMLR